MSWCRLLAGEPGEKGSSPPRPCRCSGARRSRSTPTTPGGGARRARARRRRAGVHGRRVPPRDRGRCSRAAAVRCPRGAARRLQHARGDGVRRHDALPRALGLPARAARRRGARRGWGCYGAPPRPAHREGPPRPPDRWDRRLGAAPPRAAARAPRAASTRTFRARRPRGAGSVLRELAGAASRSSVCPAPRHRPAARGDGVRAPRLRPDLVHTHLVHADVYGALAAAGGRAVLVSTKHNDDPFRSGTGRYLERLLTRRAARVICITEALARFNREVVGLPGREAPGRALRARRAARAVGAAGGPELPPRRPCSSPSAGSCRRRASTSRSRRSCSFGSGIPPRTSSCSARARCGELVERRARGVADAVSCRAGSATSPGGSGGPTSSSTRRAGRDSGSRCSRRCLRASRRREQRSARSPRSCSTGRRGCSCLRTTRRSPDAVAALLDDPARARAGRGGRQRARAEFSVARMAERTLAVYAEASPSSRR